MAGASRSMSERVPRVREPGRFAELQEDQEDLPGRPRRHARFEHQVSPGRVFQAQAQL